MFGRERSVWLRPVVGAAGRGALHALSLQQARDWLDSVGGWGTYTAAAYLSPDSVTWESIWKDGELVVAQSRRRLYWEFGDRAPSGVTGITGAGVTVRAPGLDSIARRAILAVDERPHGIFSVDLTYDGDGVPNPTEINIGRFFTTHLFFTAAGLNMPYIFVQLAFGEELPPIGRTVNPLPEGLVWVRGMDMEPVLTSVAALASFEDGLHRRLLKLESGALATT
jgi:carbamoyl-phosphate synthase large subunit